MASHPVSRRDFARLLAIGGAAPFLSPALAWPRPAPLPARPAVLDEHFWQSVRDQLVMPSDLAVLNAANLSPPSAPVLDTL